MDTAKTLSKNHHYYQITPSIISSKYLSKSSDSILNKCPKLQFRRKKKQVNKSTKMKTSQTPLITFETKPIQTPCNSTSVLRRRFSLFRNKRPQPINENHNVQALQQIIDQLKQDLQIKTDELETTRKHLEHKRSSLTSPSSESIEQAMYLQTILNKKLEEMLTENNLLKKSVQELESFAQQQKSKRIY